MADLRLNILMSALGAGAVQQAFGAVTKAISGGDGLTGALAAVGVVAGVAAVSFVAKSVQMAADFQTAMTQIQTGAGEAAGPNGIGKVSQGILDLAVSTGTSAKQLSDGMYMIESAGFHAANGGLDVLRVAAQGAQVGNADLGTVADALTTVLTNYHMSASQSAVAMNQLIETVASGKMHMQDLASSLSAVLPVAAAAHISYAQVGGAIATMTAQGVSAQQATQDLANTIRSLQNPNNVAIQEMQQMGLNANQVAQQLGKKGLTGTLAELTQAITAHMGPSGLVIMNTFQNAKVAAADANQMIKAMPGSIQHLAQAYLNGSITAKQWRTDLQAQPPLLQHLLQQFATTANKAHSFNSLLTSGSPAAQTYTAALSKMLGGATGLNTALHLTGENMATFQGNVSALGATAKRGGDQVQGWSLVQQTFNFKMAQAKEVVETFMIRLGTALLPVLTRGLTLFVTFAGNIGPIITAIGNWIQKSGILSITLHLMQGTIAGVRGAISGIQAAISAVIGFFVRWRVPILAVASAITLFILPALISMAVSGIASVVAAIPGMIASLWGMATAAASAGMTLVTTTIPALFSMATSGIVAAVTAIPGLIGGFIGWAVAGWGAAAATIAATWPILLIIAGIALLVVGIVLLVKHWGAVTAFLKTTWQAVTGWIIGALHSIASFFVSVWDHIISFLRAAWAVILSVVKVAAIALLAILIGPIGLLVIYVITHFTQVKAFLGRVWEDIKRIFSQALAFVMHLVTGFITSEIQGWTNIWNRVKAIATGLWADVKGIFNASVAFLKNLAVSLWNDEVKGWTNIWNSVKHLVQQLWADVVGAFNTAKSTVLTAITTIWNGIVNFVASWPGKALQWGKDLIQNLINGILSMVGGVGNAIGSVASKIASFIHFSKPEVGPLASVMSWMPDFGTVLATGLRAQAPKLQAAVSATVRPLTGMASQPVSALSRPGAISPSGLPGGSPSQAGAVPIIINVSTLAGSRSEVRRMTDLIAAELGNRTRGQHPGIAQGGIFG